VSVEKPPECAAAGSNPQFAQLRDSLDQRQVWMFGNHRQHPLRAFLQRETLPPRGLGLALPLSRQRCIHLIAELTLISKRSAASRRDAPISTASITRSRKSLE
jgi:hypothetical protein